MCVLVCGVCVVFVRCVLTIQFVCNQDHLVFSQMTCCMAQRSPNQLEECSPHNTLIAACARTQSHRTDTRTNTHVAHPHKHKRILTLEVSLLSVVAEPCSCETLSSCLKRRRENVDHESDVAEEMISVMVKLAKEIDELDISLPTY